ncbi:MAG TPA: hypothetical protein VJH03_04635 [Blastocatellia bacterium]|nr:hypothetical protein [Blastocatellia bacterium]
MGGENVKLPDNSKDAFEQYVLKLEREYAPWYKRASTFNKVMWVIGQSTAILAGAITAFIAALVGEGQFANLKWLLVLLPLVGAFATALLAQTRVRDILALRESGREHIETLIEAAKATYAANAASGVQDIANLHMGLVNEVSRLEKQQAVDILSIVPVVGTTSGKTPGDNKQD